MKTKLFILSALCVALFMFNACEEPQALNKFDDKTKLWPAADSTGEKFGFINEKGEMVIPAQYYTAYHFSGGVACVVTMDNRTQFINKKGEVVFTLPAGYGCDVYLSNGGRRFWYALLYEMYDENFNLIIPNRIHRKLGPMSKEGLTYFLKFDGEGFYNRKGEVVLYNPYDSITRQPEQFYYEEDGFHEGRAIIRNRRNTVYGAINTHGDLVMDTIYRNLIYVGSGLFAYQLPGGDYNFWGLLDLDGNQLTEQIYKQLYYDSNGDNGLVPIEDENRYVCYVDRTGTKVIQTSFYGTGFPFHEGAAWVYIYDPSDHTAGYVLLDESGNILWKIENDGRFLSVLHNGLCAIVEDGIVKYVDKNKNCVYSWKRAGYSPFDRPFYMPAINENNIINDKIYE